MVVSEWRRHVVVYFSHPDQFPYSPNNNASTFNYVPVKKRELIGGQSAGDDQPHARIGDIPDYAIAHDRALLKLGRSIHSLSIGRAPFLQHACTVDDELRCPNSMANDCRLFCGRLLLPKETHVNAAH